MMSGNSGECVMMSVNYGECPNSWFLSPPVQLARWAHMRRFLSVRLSVRPIVTGP